MPAEDAYRRYRAPNVDGGVLVDPGWAELLQQLGERAPVPSISLGDKQAPELAAGARSDLLAAAAAHTGEFTDSGHDLSGGTLGPLVVSGHQPELFHPGVWFKNFVLDQLARDSGGVGVHLLIDSDLCRTVSIRRLTGTASEPRTEPVAYDLASPPAPYEERAVHDRELLASFAARLGAEETPLDRRLLAADMQPLADRAAQRGGGLMAALSEPRRLVEGQWGARTLEVPFSRVADTEGFRRLAAELLLRAGDTREAYNAALAEYRSAHRLRNAAQPLPDLAEAQGWIESPLWVWSTGDPTRRSLYVQRKAGGVALTDRSGWSVEGPADAEGVVQWIADLRASGVKLRSRALVTTLYCRLILADLFLHGIGGAKYDQVTDRFAERLLGVELPRHATVTATLRLPIDHSAATDEDRLRLVKRLRDLRHHPEWFLPDSDAALSKATWVRTTKTPENAARRHREIVAANSSMTGQLRDVVESTRRDLESVEQGVRTRALLDSREYSFCLFPADGLRERMAGAVHAAKRAV